VNRGLTRKVTLVLMVPFGAALLAALLLTHFLIRTQSTPAHLNLSGSQRMLVLQIDDLLAAQAAGQNLAAAKLQERMAAYERALDLLEHGGRLAGREVAPAPAELQPLVAPLRDRWQELRPLLAAAISGRVDAAVLDAGRPLLEQIRGSADRLTAALVERAEQLRNRIRWLFSSGLGVASLLLLGGLWYTRRQVLDPIARIEQVARNLTEGDYSVRLAVRSQDELGQLAGTFNSLAERVQSLIMELTRDRAAAEARAETLSDALPLGTALLGDDLAILRTNPAFAALVGQLESEIRGRNIRELLPPTELREQLLALLAAEGPPRRVECELALPVGVRQLRITVARSPLSEADARLILVVEDRTEELRLRAEARAYEESFRRLIEAAPDAILVERDNCIVYVNPSLVETLQYGEPKALLGRSLLDLVSPDDRKAADDQLAAATETGEATPAAEYRLQRLDGQAVWFEAAAVRLDFHGASAVAVVARDISERKEFLLKMMEMDRMIAVGTLAAGVGHEINNPLSYVIANLDLLSEELPRAAEVCRSQQANPIGGGCSGEIARTIDEASSLIAEARQGAARVRSIVRELKALSRADRERNALLDIRRVLESAVNMTFNEIRHRARLIKSYGETPAVEGNEAQLGQAFINLLVNAAQAIPEGAAESHTIRIVTRSEGDQVIVEIADSGSGIAEEHRPHLFEPFFTTKAVGQGTGLGLTICRNTVEAHGGTVTVETVVGRGSVFRVALPAARQGPVPVSTPTAPTNEPSAAPARRGRILIVDDDPLVCRAVERSLAADHDVTALTDAREAHRRLLGGERFDLILCDLMMPDMTGMDLYAAIRAAAPEQAGRMIFVTGGAFTPRAIEFLDTVTNLRLDKPFDLRNLRALVRDLLAARGAAGD
jgi:PAS domain S-box-containing protein